MLFQRTALTKKPEALIRKELSALREENERSLRLVFRDLVGVASWGSNTCDNYSVFQRVNQTATRDWINSVID